jgi:magnesium chelatase family protein
MALAARQAGKRGILLPEENAREAAIVRGLEVYPVRTIREAIQALAGEGTQFTAEDVTATLQDPTWEIDFSDVRGQEHVKRALEVAAAGGHNVIMAGRRAAVKRCSRGAWPRSSRPSRSRKRWKSPSYTASPASWAASARW